MQVSDLLNREKLPAPVSHFPTKVLQFGEGNFLRAFVDWMIHEMNEKAGFNAGVTVVQPIPQGLVEKLDAQQGLYNLYLNGIRGGEFVAEHSLVDVIQKAVDPYQDPQSYFEEALNPHLQFIVSNTTEAGIQFNPADKWEDQPAASFPGKLTQFFHHRYRALPDSPKLIVLPCELIEKNGDKLKETILQYVDLWDLDDPFKAWLEEKVFFCNTLVDRIVPGYPKDSIHDYWNTLGYKDELIVEGEVFHLWVIEGPSGLQEELPTAKAGLNVIFSDDLAYYRTRKVRILNGAHTAMVPVAYLYGLDFVKEAVENSLVGKFVHQAIFEEIIPSLTGDRDELERYAYEVIDRFKNPSIKHELISISLNSFSKFKTRVLPSILGYYDKEGSLPELLLTSMAALLSFYKGKRFDDEIPLKDEKKVLEMMRRVWQNCDGTQGAVQHLVQEGLSQQELWGQDLTQVPGFVDSVANKVVAIQNKGIAKLLL